MDLTSAFKPAFPYSRMAGEHLHLVMCYPARVFGEGGAIGDQDLQPPNAVRLYVSTPSYRVTDYLVFWTPVVPWLGSTSDYWFYLGTLASLHGIDFVAARTREFASGGYVEAYLFKNEDDFADCYIRQCDHRPFYRFLQYRLDVSDPADFWTASKCYYIRTVDRRDLIRLQRPA